MSQKVEKTGQAIAVLLIVLMILRINSYFMISESATVTRVFKTGLRCLLTGISILLVILWNDPKRPTRFVYKNILALFFYLMYLFYWLCFHTVVLRSGMVSATNSDGY